MSFEIQTLFYHFDEYIEFRSNFRNSITGIFLYVSKFEMKYRFFLFYYDVYLLYYITYFLFQTATYQRIYLRVMNTLQFAKVEMVQ